MRNRKNIGTLFLAIGMFFNPFGYAELFAMVMKLTRDYWITAYIFYALAFLFFSLSFVFLNINPFKLILVKLKKVFAKKFDYLKQKK